MFERLKNWIINHPAPDHAVASFAWFGLSFLAAGTATAFPALAPVAYGTAALASKIGVLEGIFTAAHIVKNAFSGFWGKIFKPKAQPAPTKTNPPTKTDTKDNEKTSQNLKEKPKDETKEPVQPTQAPIDSIPGMPHNGQIPVQDPMGHQPVHTPIGTIPGMPQQQMIPSAEQFFALIYQTQVLAMQLYQIQVMTAQLRQMQREIFALHMENTILNQRFNFRGYQMVQRPPMPYGRLFMRHRQFRNSMIHN